MCLLGVLLTAQPSAIFGSSASSLAISPIAVGVGVTQVITQLFGTIRHRVRCHPTQQNKEFTISGLNMPNASLPGDCCYCIRRLQQGDW